MSDKKPTVISFATRKAVSEEEINATVEGPDPESVKLINDIKELVDSGRVKGLAVLAWDTEAQAFYTSLILPPDGHPDNWANMFIGGSEMIKQQLLSIAMSEFGLEVVT